MIFQRLFRSFFSRQPTTFEKPKSASAWTLVERLPSDKASPRVEIFKYKTDKRYKYQLERWYYYDDDERQYLDEEGYWGPISGSGSYGDYETCTREALRELKNIS